MYFILLSGIFLGWALGANDSANVFGTAVSSRMVKYSTAVIITAILVILGAYIQGEEGIKTLQGLTNQNLETAFVSSLAAALAVSIMTLLKLPISTSQAVVGAILGIGVIRKSVNLAGLSKIVICWIGTPIGSFVITILLYFLIRNSVKKLKLTIFQTDNFIRIGLIFSGAYGAYALGANNVANVMGVFTGDGVGNLITPVQAVLFGGISIALGAITFSKKVMFTVGKSIVKLDPFSAFITVLAQSITVHIYAILGVPVSTSQAIVGAVLGIGFIKGVQTINFKVLIHIVLAWLMTPVAGFFLAIIIYLMLHLKFVI